MAIFKGLDGRFAKTQAPWGDEKRWGKGGQHDEKGRKPFFARDGGWKPPQDYRDGGPTNFPIFTK